MAVLVDNNKYFFSGIVLFMVIFWFLIFSSDSDKNSEKNACFDDWKIWISSEKVCYDWEIEEYCYENWLDFSKEENNCISN